MIPAAHSSAAASSNAASSTDHATGAASGEQRDAIRDRRPPGPGRPKTLAQRLRYLWRFATDGAGFVGERFSRYGDIYYVPGRDDPGLYVLRHPDHLKQVLVLDAASYSKKHTSFRVMSRVLGEGLLTSDGALWKRHRRMIQPAFHRRMLESYAPIVVAEAERQLDSWRDGAIVDLSAEMMSLTLRIVARALFHHDATEDVATIAKAMAAFQGAILSSDAVPSWVPLPGRNRLEHALDEVNRLIHGMIERRRRDPLRGAPDVLQALIDAVDEEQGGRLDDREIRDELLTLFLAGHETTSHALSWTLYLLSQNPQVEAQLRHELHAALGGQSPTVEDLPKLGYTEQVLKESMRLYPPAYSLTRRAERDTAIGGYPVPRGSEVVIWTYWTHRDARWFPEPELFSPGRFAAESERQLPRLAYLPFGAGPRVCIGRAFAMLEARLILATIAQRYRLKLVSGHPVRPRTRITLFPAKGLRMRLHRRTNTDGSR